FLLDLEDDIEAGMATICALPVSRSSGGARIGLQLLGTQSHLRGDAVMHSRNGVRGEMWGGHASAAVESAISHHLIRCLMKQDRRLSLYTTFIGCAKPESPVLGSAFLQGRGGHEIEQDEVEHEDGTVGADDDNDCVEESPSPTLLQFRRPHHLRGSARRHSQNVPPPTKPSKQSSPYSRPRPSATNSFNSAPSASGTKKGGAVVEKKKSRGRGVEMISLSANDDGDDGAVVMDLPEKQACGEAHWELARLKLSRFRSRLELRPQPHPGDSFKQYMDSHQPKKGRSGAGPLGGCTMDEDKDWAVRSRKESGVAASRSRGVRSIATVEDENE
ncbi:hypothetical protein FRB98_003911, partial [Tulasnella sp. 332]